MRHLLLAALSCAVVTSADADVFTWITDGSGFYTAPANWESDGEGETPGAGDRVIFDRLDTTVFVNTTGGSGGQSVEQMSCRRGRTTFELLGSGSPYVITGVGSPLQPALSVHATEDGPTELIVTAGFGSTFPRIDAPEIVIGAVSSVHDAVLEIADADITVYCASASSVGHAGPGRLDLAAGSRFEVGELAVGIDAAAPGATVVSGGELIVDDTLRVGVGGAGTLHVDEGGRVECDDLLLAADVASTAILTVDGAGTQCVVGGFGDLGFTGSATVQIRNGARFTVVDHTVLGWSTTQVLGEEFIAQGTLEVSGGSSEALFLDDVWLGFTGAGTLRSDAGGRIVVFGDLRCFTPELSGIEIELSPGASPGAALVQVSGAIDATALSVRLDATAMYDGDESWRLLSASEIEMPTAIVRDAGHPLWVIDLEITSHAIDAVLRHKGDVNGDGVVDFSDILGVLGAWGACSTPTCVADFTGDELVDFADLLVVLAHWSN